MNDTTTNNPASDNEPVVVPRGSLQDRLLTLARERSGETPEQEQDRVAAETLAKARTAKRRLDQGELLPAWSTGEMAAVAAALGNEKLLAAEDYADIDEALDRAMAGMIDPPADPHAWLAAIRADLANDDNMY